jgi:hypothetical protein
MAGSIPIIGPMRGPREKMAIAPPLSSGLIKSPTDPAPIVKGATPAQPAQNRNASRMPRFGASPQTIVHAKKRTLEH